jgi:hypothetical protein
MPGVSDHPAHRLWVTLETLHGATYVAPGVRDAGVGLGLRGFWMTYVAFRAAPLGPVGPATVTATFAGFQPALIAKALPEAWSRTTPQACLDARARVSAAALRTAGVDPAACAAAADLLWPAIPAADFTGRALFAANADVVLSDDALTDDPIVALWQIATTLREHRGDGHVAALVSAGISGLEAHLLQVGVGVFTGESIRSARGWSEQDWATAEARLHRRGYLTDDETPALTEAGRILLTEIEARTDSAAWTGALAALGEATIDEVGSLLSESVAAVRGSGLLPAFNPTGLPT